MSASLKPTGTQISHGNAGLMKRGPMVDMPEIETDSAVSDGGRDKPIRAMAADVQRP